MNSLPEPPASPAEESPRANPVRGGAGRSTGVPTPVASTRPGTAGISSDAAASDAGPDHAAAPDDATPGTPAVAVGPGEGAPITLDLECLTDQQFEDSLEPRHLIRRSDVTLRAGIMMLGAGTSALRVRRLMRTVAQSVGLEQMSAHVSYTDITLTVSRRGIFRTQLAEIASPGVDAHRISMLHRLTHELPSPLTATEVDARLDAIEATPPLHPLWVTMIAVGLACVSVSVLGGGGWREALCVFPAAACAYLSHRTLGRHQVNHLAVVMSSSFLATGLFALFMTLSNHAFGSPASRMAAGFICAPIFLIPGFPLVTGGLDLTRIDLDAGIPRVVYACMALVSIAIGVWLVSRMVGVSPDPVPQITGPPVLVWAVLALASFVAVAGWAVMFNSPLRMAVAAGCVAVVANLPRLVLLRHGVSNHVATFVCCFVIGIGCHVVGSRFNITKITMTVPGTLVAIPGSSALRTLLYFDQGEILKALQNGILTMLAVIAMVAGLSAARMLTDPEWAFTKADPPQLRIPIPGRRRGGRGGTGA